jgi:hypothetical protein
MGFTSSSYADTSYSVTGPNEAYLFGSALNSTYTGNLVYATDSTGSANSHQWYVGGFNQAKGAWKMQLTTTGLQLANALGIAYGGTGQTTASAGFNALSPITSTGDLIVGNGTNSATRLAIGANTYVLTSNGTTATWSAPPATGVTTFSAGTTGLTPSTATSGAVTLAGTLIVSNGGTGTTSLSGLAYGNGTSAFTAATAAQVVSVIGTTAVTNATNATTATTATNANNTAITTGSATTNYLTFVTATSGNLPQLVNSGLTYNGTTNAITGGIAGGTF